MSTDFNAHIAPDAAEVATELARAKINLALHVTGMFDDGYHRLDSLVVFSDFGDRLMASANTEPNAPLASLNITGPFALALSGDLQNNLVLRAAEIFSQTLAKTGHNASPVTFTLEKNLPIASGIGGGSADAAAALRALSRLWQVEGKVDLFAIAESLGADVPMCLVSKALHATGKGTDFQPLHLEHPLHLVLANPGIEIATPHVFKALVTRQNPALNMAAAKDGVIAWLKQTRNDLQIPALSLCPQIGQVLEELSAISDCRLARMSGSGATCFGLFDTAAKAEEAATILTSRQPGWWVVASTAH